MRWRKYVFWLFSLVVIPTIIIPLTTRVVKASGIVVSVEPNTIHDTSMVPGTQFSVNITVDYVEQLWGYRFWLRFDPAVIHGVSVENGPFLGSAGGYVLVNPGPGFDNEVGQLKIFGAQIYFETVLPEHVLPVGGGVLATVTFEVVGYGSSPITLGPDTGLANKTGGSQFGDEWCYGWHPTPPEPPHYGALIPWAPWLNSLGHGSFDNTPTLYVNPSQVRGVRPDENFTINVNVINMTDLYQWEFYMGWNPALLNVTRVTEGDFLEGQPEGTSGVFYEMHNDEGYIRVNCTTIGEYRGVNGTGTLANVTFTVGTGARGTCDLTLYNVTLLDSEGNVISTRTVGGVFINLEFHDIAVTRVKPNPTEVEELSGEPIVIEVTVENRGDFNETGIDVTVYYGEHEIRTERDISLDVGAEESLTFTWNTTGVYRGKYVVQATASPVADEAFTADNTKRGGEVTISAHDIAVAAVSTPVRRVYLGHNTTVTVVVKNEGTELETLNVSAYYGGEEIGRQTVANLGYLESRTLVFHWDTTGVELGEYTISVNASVLEGEKEEDWADNTCAKEGTVSVIPLEVTALPAEVVVFPIVAAVIVGAMVFFYRRRKKGPELATYLRAH